MIVQINIKILIICSILKTFNKDLTKIISNSNSSNKKNYIPKIIRKNTK